MKKKPVIYEYRVFANDCHQIEVRHVSGGSAYVRETYKEWTPYAWYSNVEQVKQFMAFVAAAYENAPSA